jgi:hypothetical protein
LVAAPALGTVYTDPTGDIATGNSNLDITQVEITDNGTDLVVRVTLDSLDGDWGKYMFFADAWEGGSGDNDNPWGRDVSGLGGMDIFVGSWIDNGGGALGYEYGASGWGDLPFSVSLWTDWDNNTIQWNFYNIVSDLSSAGITGFDFEIGTTGGSGGDPAIDLIGAEGVQPGWGEGSHSIDRLRYDFSTIPAPGALALLGLAGLCGRRRRH